MLASKRRRDAACPPRAMGVAARSDRLARFAVAPRRLYCFVHVNRRPERSGHLLRRVARLGHRIRRNTASMTIRSSSSGRWGGKPVSGGRYTRARPYSGEHALRSRAGLQLRVASYRG